MEIKRRIYLVFHGFVENELMAETDIIKHIISNGFKLDHGMIRPRELAKLFLVRFHQ